MEHRTEQDLHYYIEAGDMRVDQRVHHTGDVDFPLSHYHGITIGFFMEQAEKGLIVPLIVKDYCAIIGLNQKDLENQGILA